MYTIRQIADAIAEAESIPQNEKESFEKGLRNLTQRFPFYTSGRDGRADLYETASACSIRIVQVAHDLGMGRVDASALAQFLSSVEPFAKPEFGSDSFMKRSVASEVIRMTNEGKDVSVFIDRGRNGLPRCRHNGHQLNEKVEKIFRSAGVELEYLMTTEIKASDLIRELLPLLSEG